MKKSMVVIVHTLFWLCFPFYDAFSEWAEQFRSFAINDVSYSPLELFIANLKEFFGQPDMGRDYWDWFNVKENVVGILIYVVWVVAVFYLYYCYFIPKAIEKKNVKSKMWPVLFLLCAPYLLIKLLSTFTFAVGTNYTSFMVLTYTYTLFFAVAGSLFRIMESWYSDRLLSEKLKQQNLQSELALLKSQINPHFLFNTLNNIDALIRKDTAKASHCLLEFSDMLRYMIYDSDAERVLLKSELQYLRNYIDIQQIQFANERLVVFDVQGESEGIQVAPMLLIPFVENAFKHCTAKDQPEAIRFSICINGKSVAFEAINLFDPDKKIHKDKIGGVGLRTIRRRLELLYPQLHTLEINDREGVYHVTLTLEANEN